MPFLANVHEANVNRDNRKGKRAIAIGAFYSFRDRVQQQQPLEWEGGEIETIVDSQSTDDDYVFSDTEDASSESETPEGMKTDPEEEVDFNDDVDDGPSDVDTDKEQSAESSDMEAYKGVIHPIPNYNIPPQTDFPFLKPPNVKRKPDRPKVRRILQEEKAHPSTAKRSCTVRCCY
ncbi:hypothetical protein JCGZ_05493 [Jatropha curcas]|uniref:Uncharacterized protein n=1 Tax=Jatropha curcas TaxID=180498 RepID=A0A067L6C4_JATCU|nr:hypothetical protein JCGZ_05493 [Jatropha curcas]